MNCVEYGMSNYTTGEMAKLCDETVRMVQFSNTLFLSEVLESGFRVRYTKEDFLNMLQKHPNFD